MGGRFEVSWALVERFVRRLMWSLLNQFAFCHLLAHCLRMTLNLSKLMCGCCYTDAGAILNDSYVGVAQVPVIDLCHASGEMNQVF